MWPDGYSKLAEYVQCDGLDYIIRTGNSPSLITWLWSLNYPLLGFFERYDATTGVVHRGDFKEGRRRCLAVLNAALDATRSVRWFVMLFDAESVEQRFVTSVWRAVAPFPDDDRSFTRKLLETALDQHVERAGGQVFREHISGIAEYGSLAEATPKMLGFHLRGHFDRDPKVIGRVQSFLAGWLRDGRVQCPAGAYLYTLKP